MVERGEVEGAGRRVREEAEGSVVMGV